MNDEDYSNPQLEDLTYLKEVKTRAFRIKFWRRIPVLITLSAILIQNLQIILVQNVQLTSLSINIVVSCISVLTLVAKTVELILPTGRNIVAAEKAFNDVSHVGVLADYVTMMLHSNGRFSESDMSLLRRVLDEPI